MRDRGPLVVWLFVIGVVALGAGATVAGMHASTATGDESASGTGPTVTTERSPSAVEDPTGSDASGARSATNLSLEPSPRSNRTRPRIGDVRTNATQTRPSYDCSGPGIELEDVTLPAAEQETYSQTAVGLEMTNSTVTRRVPEDGSETFPITIGGVETERLCANVLSAPVRSVRVQLKNPDIEDSEILGNGVVVGFERGEADYIDQTITLDSALELLPELAHQLLGIRGR